MAGHVDTPLGPAVFHRLGTLSRGAAIEIDRDDGRTALFTVDAVEVHPKKRFPDHKVYGSSGRPELRLITCGGDWASDTGYQANTVVDTRLRTVAGLCVRWRRRSPASVAAQPERQSQARRSTVARASLTSCATRAASSGLFTTSVWFMSMTRTSLAE